MTEVIAEGMDENVLLAAAAAVESGSSHPLADAIVRYAQEKAAPEGLSVSDFENMPGKGVRARLSDGRTVLIGNDKLMRENDIDASVFAEDAARLSGRGETPIMVAVDQKPAGIISWRIPSRTRAWRRSSA